MKSFVAAFSMAFADRECASRLRSLSAPQEVTLTFTDRLEATFSKLAATSNRSLNPLTHFWP